jgi:hypothetical protein
MTRLEFEASFIGVSIVFALESMSRKVQQHQLQRSNNQALAVAHRATSAIPVN